MKNKRAHIFNLYLESLCKAAPSSEAAEPVAMEQSAAAEPIEDIVFIYLYFKLLFLVSYDMYVLFYKIRFS